jgi:GrpB-like predicted nucleotidyltransferase (UPF0157 family)
MLKKLADLTKQDWDTLFPIELVDYDIGWKHVFQQERQHITEKIGNKLLSIEHVGSTSVPGIKAKPYIDICIEIPAGELFNEEIINAMESLNYHFFKQSGNGEDYMIFVKGYNLEGKKEQVFHTHMCPTGHEMLNQITFRDYLKAHPDRAKAYEDLKTELAMRYKNDRVGYRKAKDSFVQETLSFSRN